MSRKTLIALALLGAAASATQAQTLDRVEVMGQKVRTDVARSCPTVHEDLVRALAPAVHRVQKEGSYAVSFQLHGQTINDVQTATATPDEYRRPLRRAVRDLACSDAAAQAQPQRFGFIVDVRLEAAPRGGAPRYAMSFRSLP